MAESHGEPLNPDAAPMRQQVKEDFSAFAVAFAVSLAVIAAAAGAVLGIVLAND